jgi:multisubunit Na+/H+ antiporter MnhB subunit
MPEALSAAVIVLVTVATDLLALWALLEIGYFTEINFQAKFKHIWAGGATVTAGLLGSFVFMVLITIAELLIFAYL